MESIILVSIVSGLTSGVFVTMCQLGITVLREKKRKKEFRERIQNVLSTIQANEKSNLQNVLLKTDAEKNEADKLLSELKKQEAINKLSLKKKN